MTLIHRKYWLLILLIYVCSQQYLSAQNATFFADKEVGCAPLIVKFSNFSTGATSYLWKFGDGLTSTEANPEHIFYSALGEYTVTLIAYDASFNSDTATIIIDIPSNLPYFNIPDSVCPGKYVDFGVYGNSDSDNQIEWDFGDGMTSQSQFPDHAYSDTGTYMVVLTVTNSTCGTVKDTNNLIVSKNIIPPIHIHSNGPIYSICQGENFPYFYDESKQILWEFGDGDFSTDPYPLHYYDSTGTYNVKITVTNECGNSNSLDTTVVVKMILNLLLIFITLQPIRARVIQSTLLEKQVLIGITIGILVMGKPIVIKVSPIPIMIQEAMMLD